MLLDVMRRSDIRKFFCLSFAERVSFFEALVLLYFYKVLVVIFPIKWLMRWSSFTFRAVKSDPETVSTKEYQIIQSVSDGIQRAGRLTCWKKSICLINAFAAVAMLRRRGISSNVVLGVAKEEEKLIAHAWVEYGGLGVVGLEIAKDYSPLATLSAPLDSEASTHE